MLFPLYRCKGALNMSQNRFLKWRKSGRRRSGSIWKSKIYRIKYVTNNHAYDVKLKSRKAKKQIQPYIFIYCKFLLVTYNTNFGF